MKIGNARARRPHPAWLLLLAGAAALGCGDDEPAAPGGGATAGPAGGRPLYAIMYEVYSDMGSNSYLSLIDSLDVKEIDLGKAREYAGGRAFLATYNGWVFVGDPTSPIVTRYSIAADDTIEDSAMIGSAFRCWSARITSANSNPFMSGISMSVSTTSNACPERSAVRPSWALGATRTR